MGVERHFTRRTAALLLLLGVVIFIAYIYFFVPQGEVLSTFQRANPLFYSLAFVALILNVVFASLTWQQLLKVLAVKAALVKAFEFLWVGYFVDLLIPGESISSDISRIYLMTKESGENPGKVTASVIGHRVLSAVISFIGLVATSTYFVVRYKPSAVVSAFLGIIVTAAVVVLFALFYLSTHRKTTENIATWVINLATRLSRGRWRPEGLKSSAMRFLQEFHDGIVILGAQPRKLVLPILFAVLSWFFDLLIVVMVFFSLGSAGIYVPLSVIVIVYFIILGIEDIPLGIPAGVGIIEILMTNLYVLFQVPIGLSVAATVLIRFITFWAKLLIGGLTVQWLGIKALAG